MRKKQGGSSAGQGQSQINGAPVPGHKSNDGPSASRPQLVGVGERSYTTTEAETDADNAKFQQDFFEKLFKFKNARVNIDTILVSKSSSQQNRVEYPAHKIILRTCPYFEKLFILSEKMSIELGDTTQITQKDRDENNIEKHFIDTEPEILENILKYIYTGIIDVNLSNFHNIFIASKLLELDNLTKKLLKIRPKGTLTKDSWLELFRYSISEKATHFFQEVCSYIKLNIKEFFLTSEFMSLEYEELEILVIPPSRFFTDREKYQCVILKWWNDRKSTVPIESIVKLLNSPFENGNQNNHLNSSSSHQEQGQSLANENCNDDLFDKNIYTPATILESPVTKSVDNFQNETTTFTTTRKRKRGQSSTTTSPEKNQQRISKSLESSKINHEDKKGSSKSEVEVVEITENTSNILLDEDSLFKSCNICKKIFGGVYKDRKSDLYVHLERNHGEIRREEWKKYQEMEKKFINKNSSSTGSGSGRTGVEIDVNNPILLKRSRRKNLRYDNHDEGEINRSGNMDISPPTPNQSSNSDLVNSSVSINSEDSQQSQVGKRPSRGRPSVNKDKDGVRNSISSSDSVKIKRKLQKPIGYKTKRGGKGKSTTAKPHWKHVQKMKQNLESGGSNNSIISITHDESTSNDNLSNYIKNGHKIIVNECYIKIKRLDEATVNKYRFASESASTTTTTTIHSPSKLKNNQDGLSDVTDFDLDLLEDDWKLRNVNEEIWLPSKSFITPFSDNSDSAAVEKFEWNNCEIIFLAKTLKSNTLMRYSFKERTFIGSEITLPFPNLENFGLVVNSKRLYLIGGNSYSETLVSFSEINSCPLDKIKDWDNSCFWLKENDLESERALFSSILIGKYIYILGGSNQEQPTNYIERYNTDGDYTEWPDPYLKDCNLHYCRERFSIAHYENKIFVSGGIGNHWEKPRPQLFLKTTEVFDIGKRKTYALNDMIYKRVDHKLIFFQDKLYCIGGLISTKKTATIEIFDLESKEWKVGPQMNNKRSNLAAFVLDDNLYVLGGNDGDPTMEKYDLDSGWVFVECGNFPKDRELDFSQSVLVHSKYLYNFPPHESKDISSDQETQLFTFNTEVNSEKSNGTNSVEIIPTH